MFALGLQEILLILAIFFLYKLVFSASSGKKAFHLNWVSSSRGFR